MQLLAPRMMLAISSRSPNARRLIDATARLAAQLNATWFVVHVRRPPELHYRREATFHPLPKDDLAYAEKLGAHVVVEHGNVTKALAKFARTMSITYFVTGRSHRPRISFTWRLPLTEQIQRMLPNAMVVII